MKLSTKGRYAVSALFDIASQEEGALISAKTIAKRQAISLSYLEQILSKLSRAGLLIALKGPTGGYKLAKKPTAISIGEIIRATDGPIALADCVPSAAACSKGGCCSTKRLWQSLSGKFTRLLDSTSVADLCSEVKP